MSIYKACDIRGVAGSDLTPELYERLGRAIARMMGDGKTIAVGGDLRASTPSLKAAFAEGLARGGRAVTDLGMTPTPVVYFAQRHLGAHACAVVTASHNPPEYNGLKFMLGDLPVLSEDVDRLRELVEGSDEALPVAGEVGAISSVDVMDDYVDWVVEAGRRLLPRDWRRARDVRVVVDAGNGTYSVSYTHLTLPTN